MALKPFRQRVGAEFLQSCVGKEITFSFERNGIWKAFSKTMKIAPTVKIGLRTKDPIVNAQRQIEASLTLSKTIQVIVERETGRDHDRICSLASEFYENYRFQTETSPDFSHDSRSTVEYCRNRAIWCLQNNRPTGIILLDEMVSHVTSPETFPDLAKSFFKVHHKDDLSSEALERQFGMLLSPYGLNPRFRQEDRHFILLEVHKLMMRFATSNDRKPPDFFIEHGSPRDEVALIKENIAYARAYERQFTSTGNQSSTSHTSLSKVTWEDLLKMWQMEKPVTRESVRSWQNVVRVAVEIFGHDDVSCLRKNDFRRWRQAMLSHSTISVKTAKQNHLTALNRLLNVGVENDLLEANYLKGVRFHDDKEPSNAKKEYSTQEVMHILRETAHSSVPAYRWIPLILATSGARCKEIASLWHDQIECEQGVWVFSLRRTKDDIRPKNRSSYRSIPIHSTLIQAGFLEFASSRAGLPLFYNPPEVYGRFHPAGVLVTRMGEYIKSVRDKDCTKPPTHGFRHYIISLLRQLEPDGDRRDYIVGHKRRGEQDTYGSQWLEGIRQTINKFSTPSKDLD